MMEAPPRTLTTPRRSAAGPSLLRHGRFEIADSPEPSPTAVAAMAFSRLAALRDDPALAAAAAGVLRAYAGSAPQFAASASTYFRALRWATGPVTTVVVVEEPGEDGRGPLLDAALRATRPATVVRRLAPEVAGAATTDGGVAGGATLPDVLRAMVTGEAPRAYVCAGRSCASPVTEPDVLKRLLETFAG